MNRKRKLSVFVASTLLLVTLLTTVFATVLSADTTNYYGSSPYINALDGSNVYFDKSQYLNGAVIHKLPDSIKDDDEISLIIEIPGATILDHYNESETDESFSSYANSDKANPIKSEINADIQSSINLLDQAGVEYTKGISYSTLIKGYEIVVLAKEYSKVCKALSGKAEIHLSNNYERADTQLVENKVNVYETGIFNSEGFGYDGTGIVVAVLDTGLDYYHTAFSVDNFTADRNKLGLTINEIRDIINSEDMASEKLRPGLTAEDVYVNEKVPYAFDYADGDSEVYPIKSDHGTHVAGIIAGKNDTITGVAPNAQLAIMKIFSDSYNYAKSSWIIGALEDCANLGVDVINMSIGSACGFSTPSEENLEAEVYSKLEEMGMSLVVAASNSYNSAYNSEKNGNLPLTSNPDSATVGSPASYKGSLAVASISGVRTSYLLYGDKIIYFNESSDRVSEEKHFVEELLGTSTTEVELEYVTIPGAGRTADYTGIDVKGKIALISRGSTTFEEKANVAQRMGATAAIIYNNVSGDIMMNVGTVTIPVCSISQDDGKALAANATGKIKIAYSQAAGPFMSNFSSWGPGPNLTLKPEITAHGGNITSSVPGEDYDTISGTSMAAPNIAGVAALLRQYVIENFPDSMIKDENGNVSLKKVTQIINRLMMSTADIVINKNNQPYSVRKQGAGLANLFNCSATGTYILTYDENGEVMDKTKFELGDDPSKSGVYTLKFTVDNFGSKAVSYDVSAYVMTETVSETKTGHGETTVAEEAYILGGATVTVTKLNGSTPNGNSISIAAGAKADVEVTITLSDSDKKYLNDSFENGMYVEGFLVLNATSQDTVDLSAPYLAFYGDWTQAPIFDLTYFDTNKDELDESLDLEDKTLADAYATRPIGGLYNDYISYLGAYYFVQDPTKTQIAADMNHISLSNTEETVNSIYGIWAGLLRNARSAKIVITNDATGEVIFTRTEEFIRKSYGDGGEIRAGSIDVEFSAIEHNLKNNTKYTVTVDVTTDYGDGGVNTNKNNRFTFPFYTDFQSPTITGVEFYTEYDRSSKKNRLYAKAAIYDNHYSMAALFGYTTYSDKDLNGDGQLNDITIMGFDQYLTPIFSEYNSTSYVVYELTDYIQEIKAKSSSPNSILISCYDYALNQSYYEVGLPDEYTDLYFEEKMITLSPNEVYTLTPKLYPGTEWAELLEYTSEDPESVGVIDNEIIALEPGTVTTVKATGKDANGKVVSATVQVKVLSEGDPGYKYIDVQSNIVKGFKLTGFKVDRAFYFLASSDRDIGTTGGTIYFTGNSRLIKMYPGEEITLLNELRAYVDGVKIVYEDDGNGIVEVDPETGNINALKKGMASVTARVLFNDQSTYYSETIDIEVKESYTTMGPWITNYYGLGGKVVIPESLGVTEISQYAFTNYDYVPKNSSDVINEEDPYKSKIWYIGDDELDEDKKITEVVIPEGVEVIGDYAFAGLTALEKVTLPSTLKKIDVGAFYNCVKLKEVVGLEYVKFINQNAFTNTSLVSVKLDNAIAIADGAFSQVTAYGSYYKNESTDEEYYRTVTIEENNRMLKTIELSATTQSIGASAFYGNTNLETVTIGAAKLKVGDYAFAYCEKLEEIKINAAVIPVGAFYGDKELKKVTIGKDVAVINEAAFALTSVNEFIVETGNAVFKSQNGEYLTSIDGTELLLATPTLKRLTDNGSLSSITTIGTGAFAGNTRIDEVNIPSVTTIKSHAFNGCTNLQYAYFGEIKHIGDSAFRNTAVNSLPTFSSDLKEIGNYAYYATKLTSVTIPDGVKVGDYAFAECGTYVGFYPTENPYGINSFEGSLKKIIIGDNVTIGTGAFAYNINIEYSKVTIYQDFTNNIGWYVLKSPLNYLTIGDNVTIGNSAFYGASNLESVDLGEGCTIGELAFYNATRLTDIDLSKVTSIGDNAFYGILIPKYRTQDLELSGPPANPTYKDYVFIDEEKGIIEYSYNSAPLASIDLSSLTSIGEQAFAYNKALTTVTLGEGVTAIPHGAFYECSNLTSIDLSNIKTIGEVAFASTGLTSVDLSSIATDNSKDAPKYAIGPYAFVTCNDLTTVTFGATFEEGKFISIAEGAFSECKNLTTVENLNKIKVIGDYAFAYTGLTALDLTGATHIGSHAFMKDDNTDVTLLLGECLEMIGENPFVNCDVAPLTKEVVVEVFNGKEYKELVNTFDVSEAVKVIDGSIYRVVPNGLEFISYCGTAGDFTVAEGTVRISAFAFSGTDIKNVILPYTLEAVGHKAFFDCEKLSLVTFTSYEAPILEEEYDYSMYATFEFLPITGGFDLDGDGVNDVEGLGITEYKMWNITSLPCNVYYGANFKDYIGKISSKPVMVKPSNGQHYDSFIFAQYFDTVIEGAVAADDTTLAAIEAISKIPDSVTLADEAIVNAAREAYNKISTNEQKALVLDYQRLTNAENKISDLKYLANQGGSEGGDVTPEPEPTGLSIIAIIAIIAGSIVGGAGIAVGIYFLVRYLKKKNGGNAPDADVNDTEKEEVNEAEATENAEVIAEETAEEASDVAENAAVEAETNTDEEDSNDNSSSEENN